MHTGAIERIRRVLKRYSLDPIALGPPLRKGDDPPWEYADGGADESPLLDFGDAREGSFFPGLKAASVKSLIPLGEAAGRPLKRLIDPDLGLTFQSSGWGSQYVPPPLVVNLTGSRCVR